MPTAFITAPPDEADDLANALVEERLAACVNRLPCRSVYRWDGAIYDDEEVILLAKTSESTFELLESRVEELHPYDVPCVERFDEDAVLEAYCVWRDDAVVDG